MNSGDKQNKDKYDCIQCTEMYRKLRTLRSVNVK